MSRSPVIANIARGWNRDPIAEVDGVGDRGLSAALWTHDDDTCQEVWAEPDPDHHMLAINFVTTAGVMELDGRLMAPEIVFAAGSSHLIHAGKRPRAVFKGSLRCLHLYLPTALVRNTLDSAFGLRADAVELIDPKCAIDRSLRHIGAEILNEMQEERPLSRLRIDILGQDLAIHLARRWSSLDGVRTGSAARGGLSPARARRARQRLLDDLDEDLSLATLAGEVGLSPAHFARAFRASVGEAPCAFQRRARLSRAADRVASTSDPLAEIAAEAGYASQQGFTTAFRRAYGVTPARYRRERRG